MLGWTDELLSTKSIIFRTIAVETALCKNHVLSLILSGASIAYHGSAFMVVKHYD